MGRAFEFRKERKFKRWSKMAKTFTKIGREIAMATKDGGPDPEVNSRLRLAIQNAKAANMPKDTVARAIKNACDKDTADYKEILFEGYGPHGIAILVETASDNNNRTVANVRACFNKCNGNMGTTGSVSFMFDHKCHLKIDKGELDPEELEFELIDHGAEEVFLEEEHIMIYGNFEAFGSLQAALEGMKLEIVESGFERIPQTMTKLDEEQEADIEKLLEKLEDEDDVQNVFHNMA